MRRWLRQSAIFFTIIEACHRRSIYPQEYLHKVLTQLATMTTSQIEEVPRSLGGEPPAQPPVPPLHYPKSSSSLRLRP